MPGLKLLPFHFWVIKGKPTAKWGGGGGGGGKITPPPPKPRLKFKVKAGNLFKWGS